MIYSSILKFSCLNQKITRYKNIKKISKIFLIKQITLNFLTPGYYLLVIMTKL